MMKEKIYSLLIVIALGALIMKLGWWFGVWPAAILAAFLNGRKLKVSGFILSFIAGFLLWGIWSGVLQYYYGEWITPKVVQLLDISSAPVLFVIISLVGGILSLLGWTIGWSLSRNK